jgi:Rha family phage regulatory protein
MTQLVFVAENKVVTDSLTISEVFGKEHKHVMRDIEIQIEKLNIAGEVEFSKSNFGLSNYTSDRGRIYQKFNLSEDAFTLVAMSYVTPEAMKFKVKFIEAFKKMREQLTGPKILSEREQLMASMRLSLETAEEITLVKGEVKEIRGMVENQITLDHGEQLRIKKGVGSRVYEIESDPAVRTVLFRELYRDIKDRFGVASYRDIKRKDILSAINYINAWIPRKVTQ